jgi:hypothetical protein
MSSPPANRRRRLPQPRESLARCAVKAQLRGDPMLGTAFPARRLLLVEQPGPWGAGGLRESRFDAAVALELERRGRAAGVRVQAIRRPGRTPRGALRHWASVDTTPGQESVRWGSYEDDADLLGLPFDAPPDAMPVAEGSDSEPLFLVCAHSKHDACCALRGRNVAAALEAVRPGRVWECTHLGGDRFAANVLVLPTGLLYGRLLPFAAPEFAAAADAGEVVGALLRGRVGLVPHAQAALAYAYEQLALRRAADLRVLSASSISGGIATVHLATPHGQVVVSLHVERVRVTGLTCADSGPGSFLSYRPTGISLARDDMPD